MKKSKKVEKPLGSTRKQIEDTLQNLERFRVHFSVVSDKFAKALQASSASAQQLRYVADDIAREATELSKHEPQLALGQWLKKLAKQFKQANDLLNTMNQTVTNGFIQGVDDFIRVQLTDIRANKKQLDKICSNFETAKSRYQAETSKKKTSEKKLQELEEDFESHKQTKKRCKEGTMKLLQQTEEKLYKQTLTNMWDSSAALQRYFDDGARIFRNAVHEVQTTRSPPPETPMDRLSPARMTLIKQPSCRASRSNSLSFADRPAQVATDRLVHSANVAKEDPGSLGSARNRPKKDNKPKAEVILAQKFQYEIKHASSPGLALLLKALYKQNLFSTRIQMLNKNFLEPLSQEPCKSKLIHADQFFPGNLSELQQRHLSCLSGLQDCKLHWPTISLAQTLLNTFELMKIYKPVILKLGTSNACVEFNLKKNRGTLAPVIASQKDGEELLRLINFPLKILPHFKRLFQELSIIGSDSDKELSDRVLKNIDVLNEEIELQRTDKALVHQALFLEEQILGLDETLIPPRKFLRQGPAAVLVELPFPEDDQPTPVKSKMHLILFADTLFLTKKNSKPLSSKREKGQREQKFKLLHKIDLFLSQFENLLETEVKLVCSQSKDEQTTITISFKTREEKLLWENAFEHAFEDVASKKVFGISLDGLMKTSREKNQVIPSLIEKGIHYLVNASAVQHEGLVRVSGNAQTIMNFCDRVNRGAPVHFENMNAHDVIGVLKKFFRDLPSPIFPPETHASFLQTQELSGVSEKVTKYKELLEALPVLNQFILQQTINFFSLLSSYSEENKMTAYNIAIVMAPIFFSGTLCDVDSIAKQNLSIVVVTDLISYSKDLFVDIKERLAIAKKKAEELA